MAIGVHLYAFVPIRRPVDKMECKFERDYFLLLCPARVEEASASLLEAQAPWRCFPLARPAISQPSLHNRVTSLVSTVQMRCAKPFWLDTPPVDSMHGAVNMQVAVKLMCCLSCRTEKAPNCGVWRIRAS
jgi:hypothetical protein